MKHKDFTDFLWSKFYKENPTALDDESIYMFSCFVAELDIDDVIKWADEYKAEV